MANNSSGNIQCGSIPEDDQERFWEYFKDRFPDTEYSDYKNGVYSIDLSSREQWESIEDFPPYEINIEQGENYLIHHLRMVIITHHVLRMKELVLDKTILILMKTEGK